MQPCSPGGSKVEGDGGEGAESVMELQRRFHLADQTVNDVPRHLESSCGASQLDHDTARRPVTLHHYVLLSKKNFHCSVPLSIRSLSDAPHDTGQDIVCLLRTTTAAAAGSSPAQPRVHQSPPDNHNPKASLKHWRYFNCITQHPHHRLRNRSGPTIDKVAQNSCTTQLL